MIGKSVIVRHGSGVPGTIVAMPFGQYGYGVRLGERGRTLGFHAHEIEVVE